MSWATVRDAVHAAIVAASGLSASKVIWKWQNVGAPALDYIVIDLGAALIVGQDYTIQTYDEDADPGEEIEISLVGLREVALTIEAYSGAVVSSSSAADALEIGERTRSGLGLPGVRAALAVQSFTPFDTAAPVQFVPTIAAAGFRGRAVHVSRCYMRAPDVKEYVGFIETMEGTLTTSGGGAGDNARAFVVP